MKSLYCGLHKKVVTIIVITGLLPSCIAGQSLLDTFVHEGLKNNIKVLQKSLSVEQAQESRNAVKSHFLPSVNILGSYSIGGGGRTISVPVGDLLNPVYTTLNKLTSSSEFSTVENVSENFIANNFFDGKVRTTMPLLNSEMKFEKNISELKVALAQTGVELSKRQLVLDIKLAYFSLQLLLNTAKIYDSTLAVVNRIVDINGSLYKNGKILYSNYLRAQNEAQQVKTQLNIVMNQAANAKMYFNYLLNRNLESEVKLDTALLNASLQRDTVSIKNAVREELKGLRVQAKINQYEIKKAKSFTAPHVNVIFDAGPQTTGWKFDKKAWYYQAAIQFTFPLYNASKNSGEIKQKKILAMQTVLEEKNTAALLGLAALSAAKELNSANQKYAAATEQVKTNSTYYRIIEKAYKEGASQHIELLDARNQLTVSWLQEKQSFFEVLVATAKLERETASYKLEDRFIQ
jgi:outer membrane protein